MTNAIRSLGLHDVEDTSDFGGTYFFVKAIGGYIQFQDTDVTDVNVHFRYLTDRRADVRRLIWETATDAGVAMGKPWSTMTGAAT